MASSVVLEGRPSKSKLDGCFAEVAAGNMQERSDRDFFAATIVRIASCWTQHGEKCAGPGGLLLLLRYVDVQGGYSVVLLWRELFTPLWANARRWIGGGLSGRWMVRRFVGGLHCQYQ